MPGTGMRERVKRERTPEGFLTRGQPLGKHVEIREP